MPHSLSASCHAGSKKDKESVSAASQNAYVYGTKGHIFIPNFYGAEKIVVNSSIGEETIISKYQGNGFEEEITEASQCIINGKMQSDILPLDESITIMKQMDEIRRQIGIKYPFEK